MCVCAGVFQPQHTADTSTRRGLGGGGATAAREKGATPFCGPFIDGLFCVALLRGPFLINLVGCVACPDQAVGSLLAVGVHPRNAHQDATVVCPNHASSTKFHELVGKAHQEENEAGSNVFLRPASSGAFQAW
jgi:hypothetical protein